MIPKTVFLFHFLKIFPKHAKENRLNKLIGVKSKWHFVIDFVLKELGNLSSCVIILSNELTNTLTDDEVVSP